MVSALHAIKQRTAIVIACLGAFLPWGCQANRSGGGAITELPAELVVWQDPLSGATGSSVRDVNNDPERFVAIGTNGQVQFLPDATVCNDCTTDGPTIDLGGGALIDIRFGVAAGDTQRRPFLVDRTSGNFIQLLGGGSDPIAFQVTTEPFEEDDDSSDDLAIEAGSTDNPAVGGGSGSGGAAANPLCGALGGAILPLLLLPLAAFRRQAART